MNEDHAAPEPGTSSKPSVLLWTVCALAVALVGVGGSLWLSIGMGLKACPLCYYQRTFLMAVTGMLLVGLLTDARSSALPDILALPAAVGGLSVALFHVGLEVTGKLECPAGLLGIGTAPVQSLAIFILLLIPIGGAVIRSRKSANGGFGAALTGIVVGAMFAVGGIQGAPPLPASPSEPYDEPPIVCRPPYQP